MYDWIPKNSAAYEFIYDGTFDLKSITVFLYRTLYKTFIKELRSPKISFFFFFSLIVFNQSTSVVLIH